MNIKKTVTGNTAVMEIEGWLNTQTASELGEALEMLESNVTELIVDMSTLEYISSSGLRQIVAAYKKMDGHLTIKNVSPEIMDVFNMTGLSKKLHII